MKWLQFAMLLACFYLLGFGYGASANLQYDIATFAYLGVVVMALAAALIQFRLCRTK